MTAARSVSIVAMRQPEFVPGNELERQACQDLFSSYNKLTRDIYIPNPMLPGESVGEWLERLDRSVEKFYDKETNSIIEGESVCPGCEKPYIMDIDKGYYVCCPQHYLARTEGSKEGWRSTWHVE